MNSENENFFFFYGEGDIFKGEEDLDTLLSSKHITDVSLRLQLLNRSFPFNHYIHIHT